MLVDGKNCRTVARFGVFFGFVFFSRFSLLQEDVCSFRAFQNDVFCFFWFFFLILLFSFLFQNVWRLNGLL